MKRQQLIDRRLKRGFTQQGTADLLSMSRTVYARIEHGTREISDVEMLDICQILRCKPEDIFPVEAAKSWCPWSIKLGFFRFARVAVYSVLGWGVAWGLGNLPAITDQLVRWHISPTTISMLMFILPPALTGIDKWVREHKKCQGASDVK